MDTAQPGTQICTLHCTTHHTTYLQEVVAVGIGVLVGGVAEGADDSVAIGHEGSIAAGESLERSLVVSGGGNAAHLVSEEVVRLELDGHPGAIAHQLGSLQPAELPAWGEGKVGGEKAGCYPWRTWCRP